jgi:hypothetical protein
LVFALYRHNLLGKLKNKRHDGFSPGQEKISEPYGFGSLREARPSGCIQIIQL